MFDRLTVNVLLKSAILVLASAIVMVLAVGAVGSWNQVHTATRIANNADASAHLFTALHNLRVDRSFSSRALQAEKTGDFIPLVRDVRAAELTALNAGLLALQKVEFPAGSTIVADLRAAVDRLIALHKESDAAIMRPKAERRAGLSDEFFKSGTVLMSQLDKTSSQLANMVKLEDPFIDQLLQLKQLAWLLRNGAGDAAALVTNSFDGQPSAEALQVYSRAIGSATTAMTAVEEFSAALPVPASFIESIARAKQEFFSSEYAGERLRVLQANIAGQKLDIDLAAWDKTSVTKLAFQLKIAENALQLAKEHSAKLYSSAQNSLIVQLGLLAAALALVVTMMIVISRRVIAPLQVIQGVMLKLAGGDFNVDVPRITRQDEVGQIVASVNTMVGQIRTTIAEIKSSAREVTNASAEISASTTDLSQRTEEQAASLEETSASMEEISSTVKKNAENARHASDSAITTKDVADRGGQVVAQAVHAMAKIEDSSRKISDIIGVIDEIARQTNLLALNAAVEAARAGEAGRGFAVVASEVRSLAQRSSQAAKDIKDLITNSNSQVKDGVDLVNRAGTALSEIVASIKSVADIVADIATASSEQATGIDEVNKALTQMDGVTQQNSALVEENAATAKTLEFQAKSMDDQVAFFQINAQVENDAVEALPRQAVLRRNVAPAGRSRASVAA